MVRRLAVIVALAASLPVDAQQPDVPIISDTSGVGRLQFATYVPPKYPLIALSARVFGEVALEATVDANGQPRDIRVMQSIPLLDQAAADAVRAWRFERQTGVDVPPLVRVPITVTFPDPHQAWSVSVPVSEVQSVLLPRDFAILFMSNCPNGGEQDFNTATGLYEKRIGGISVRAQLWADPPLLEAVHDVIVKRELMSDMIGLAQWPDAPMPPPVQITRSGIQVSVPVNRSINFVSRGALYLLEVRMNGTWTRLFPPANWRGLYPPDTVEPRDDALQRGVRQIARLFEKHIQSLPTMKTLPRDQQWCRWPD